MKDQVVTIKTHTESSKSELSSGCKRPFKVSITILQNLTIPSIKNVFVKHFDKNILYRWHGEILASLKIPRIVTETFN